MDSSTSAGSGHSTERDSHVDSAHDEHGSTPAAWTGVAIVTIAFTVGTLAVILGNWPLFGISAGLVVLGPVVGLIMRSMGLGRKPAARASRTR